MDRGAGWGLPVIEVTGLMTGVVTGTLGLTDTAGLMGTAGLMDTAGLIGVAGLAVMSGLKGKSGLTETADLGWMMGLVEVMGGLRLGLGVEGTGGFFVGLALAV